MYLCISRAGLICLVVVYASSGLAADHTSLSAIEASQLAARLANADCQRRFSCSPFDACAGKSQLSRGRWHWRAIAGHGYLDLVADVSFSKSGENAKVRLDLMDSRLIDRR
jgi:hypothetical protein